MPPYKEHEIVKLKRNIDSIPAGAVGTIVFVYHDPRVAYEIEFLDNNGNTLGILTVEEENIEKVPKA
ncbi:DUF4926 domain-containing protein [Leptospira licerasiae]|uniref:DUF4926 domain-containing protein n=1 Tax=Leptospira licerasiae str. MMD4847 TaxID=1049971 RepID=A0ABN0HD97_9LEPT|nr:DUF4926 domain-containing protein [Leptospira licerasiae]EIE01341.1 hypothetical protein LEP1GSC185_3525 [Leptospira licerasiae serovar Varillal str. VAR 010]EJZ43604.1 hypothetical protein LEP1GSC178_3140 [Leptospira licerasiae str. MMD4847]